MRGLWDGEEEARFVGDEIEALQRKGTTLGQIAVLVRAGFQTREFEERFITLGMPYRVIGGPRFYERQEIRDAHRLSARHRISRTTISPSSASSTCRGAASATRRCRRCTRSRARSGVSLSRGGARGWSRPTSCKPAARKRARGAAATISTAGAARRDGVPHVELAEIVLDESGYTAMWQADKSPDAPGRLENLKELVAAMDEFETLAGFLEHVSLVMENAEAAPATWSA